MAALILDIDVTLTKGNQKVIKSMVSRARDLGAEVYVNTARLRHNPFHQCVSNLTRHDLHIPINRHYCRSQMNGPHSKLKNMDDISEQNMHIRPKCMVLVDDRLDNCKKVEEGGYSSVLTPEGIQEVHADKILKSLSYCMNNKSSFHDDFTKGQAK